jgi:hypothetical protein
MILAAPVSEPPSGAPYESAAAAPPPPAGYSAPMSTRYPKSRHVRGAPDPLARLVLVACSRGAQGTPPSSVSQDATGMDGGPPYDGEAAETASPFCVTAAERGSVSCTGGSILASSYDCHHRPSWVPIPPGSPGPGSDKISGVQGAKPPCLCGWGGSSSPQASVAAGASRMPGRSSARPTCHSVSPAPGGKPIEQRTPPSA